MSRTLNTLPEDIYKLLDRGVSFTPDPSNLNRMTTAIAGHFTGAMGSRDKGRELGKLWFSDLGEKCNRKLWYKWNQAPSPVVETIHGHTAFKFLYGNLIEEALIILAREAGHLVEREQERIEYKHSNGWTISGRIDAVIDGVLIDVKSTSSFGYAKYTKEGVTTDNDAFGYAAQLSGYYNLMEKEGRVLRTAGSLSPHFIFADKQNGHIGLVPIDPIPKVVTLADVDNVGLVTEELSPSMLQRGYEAKPEGKSGNFKLGTACSYCAYKRLCWPGLRGYAYSSGPVFLTKVVRPPNVPELFNDQ